MEDKTLFECSDDDFMIRGRDKKEIMDMARMHLREKHGMDASDEELMAKVREI